MRGVYTAMYSTASISAAGQLLNLECGVKSIEIMRVWAHTVSPSTAEQLLFEIRRITAAGSTGTAITERAHSNDGTSATANPYQTDRAPTAANAIVAAAVPNVGGWTWIPTPEERIECNAATDGITLYLNDTPSGAHVFHVGVTWREIG